ncbi:hypothetical protein ACKWTF_005224 [Chironomus riparius]
MMALTINVILWTSAEALNHFFKIHLSSSSCLTDVIKYKLILPIQPTAFYNFVTDLALIMVTPILLLFGLSLFICRCQMTPKSALERAQKQIRVGGVEVRNGNKEEKDS